MTPSLPAAVLWDMDGTLVDTEPEWIAAERDLVEASGGVWTEQDSLNLVGSALLDAGEYIRARGNLPMTAEAVVDAMVARLIVRLKQSITWRPGARELLTDLQAWGVPCALVTMSYRSLVDVIVSALPPDTFAVTVTGDEVARGKPHPEPYLTAARELGVDPAQCIVIEDSTTGAHAGLAAGAAVVAVPGVTSVDAPEATIVSTLAGLDALDLARLAGR
jgi:HAD superfamily hydrolase (TIGR01509 family)